MPDIREIINALSIDDRALWSEHRTIMRRSYLNAHNNTVGVAKWSPEDDAFLDLIDIRLALLFDRAGRLHAVKEIIGNGDKIESDLKTSEDRMKGKVDPKYEQAVGRIKRIPNTNVLPQETLDANDKSDATKMLLEGFSSEWPKGNDK